MERFLAVLGPIRDLDFNDDDQDCLVWAVQSGQLAKVKYLMTWPKHSPHKPLGTKFELAVVEAIRLRRWDMVQYLFGLHQWTRGEGVPVRARVADLGFVTTMGLMVACHNGDLETVELFYRTIQLSELDQQHPHHRRNALMYACRSGNPNLVSFLLRQDHMKAEVVRAEGSRNSFMCTNGYRPTHYEGYGVCGGERWGFGSIFVTATNDDTRIAQMVVNAGHPVSAKQYQQAAVVAIDFGHHRFLEWLLDHTGPALTDPASDLDLLGMACVRGTVEVLEVLASHGLVQNRALWAGDCCASLRQRLP